MGKNIGLFLLKAFTFAAAFWLSWIFIFRPVSALTSTTSAVSGIKEQQQSEAYEQQLQLANEQLAVASAQQKRMDAVLLQWEEQAKRYEVILQKWEQQTGARK
jgi:hypothetical protein